MKIFEDKLVTSFILSLGLVFNILIFGPIEIYYTNVIDFWFPPTTIIPIIVVVSFIIFLSLFSVLQYTNGKTRKILSRIIFTFNICLYIQGNFLNIGYSVLDGSTVDWNSMIKKGIINTLFWLFLIIFPYNLKKMKKDENFWKYQSITTLAIFLVQLLTLYAVIAGIELGLDNSNLANKDYYLDQSNMFNLSEENNIVLFVSDTFEGTYMNELLEEKPEYKEKLKDFTYFDNTTTTSTQTFMSMPIIFTGESSQTGNNLQENLDYCFNNTEFYDVLKEYNYTTEIYTEPALIPFNSGEVISNKVNGKLLLPLGSRIKLTGNVYKMVLYRYMPHFLKMPFYMYGTEMNTFDSVNIDRYMLDDVRFNELLKNGIKSEYPTNSFKIYHLNGVHTPYTITEDIEENNTEEYILGVDENERRLKQAEASIKILLNYVEELKESNVYDNTTIIFIADHGWTNRYYTTLMIKPVNVNSDFEISHAPISLLEDLHPTILNIASNSKDYGKDIWDYQEGEERIRKIYNYTFTRGDNVYKILSKITVETRGDASDIDSYYIAKEEYAKNVDELEKEYKFNDEINYVENKNLDLVSTKGILLEDIRTVMKGHTMSQNTQIILNRKKTEQDITANFKIKSVYYGNQEVIFKINGEKIHSEILKEGNNMQNIKFTIDKDLWNESDKLELLIELPNAVLGDPSILGQETLYMSIWIESFKFYN